MNQTSIRITESPCARKEEKDPEQLNLLENQVDTIDFKRGRAQ